MRGRALSAVLGAALLLLAGCVGTTSRSDFEAEIRSRGGGMDERLVIEAVEIVGDELGEADYEVTSIVANPASASVVIDARGLASPDELDGFTVHRGKVTTVVPRRLSATDDLDEDAFAVSTVRLDRLDEMVDEAHEGFGSEGSWVDSVSVRAERSEDRSRYEPVIRIRLESDRSAAEARFSADGRLLEVQRR